LLIARRLTADEIKTYAPAFFYCRKISLGCTGIRINTASKHTLDSPKIRSTGPTPAEPAPVHPYPWQIAPGFAGDKGTIANE
jgi:hypothetical protein